MERTDAMTDDRGLEAFFVASRAEAPAPSEALMVRIMADAEAELAARTAPPRRRQSALARHWRSLLANLGGWPALAGMVTATVAGVWLGFASPDNLNALSGGILLPGSDTSATTTYDLEDMLPGYADFGALATEVQG